jgi:tetratricopeptide (TPR) repeat protein
VDPLRVLRELAERQQYAELIETAEGSWELTGEPGVLALLALAHAQRGERRKADQRLREAFADLAALDASSLVDAAAAQIVLQRVGQAVETLERALEQQPNHGLGLARLGFCRMLRGEVPAARELFERANQALPGRLPILASLAHACLVLSDFAKAGEALEAGFDALEHQRSGLPEALFRQYFCQIHGLWIQRAIAEDAPERAEEHLRELAEGAAEGSVEPDDAVQCLAHYGRLLAEQGRYQEAEEALREHLARAPSIPIFLQLSRIAQTQGHFQQAIRLLQSATRHEPENIAVWAALAGVCLQTHSPKARKAAERAVELAEAETPDADQPARPLAAMQRAQAQTSLAQVDSHEGHFEAAEERFRAILAEHGEFIPALQSFGHQQLQRGNLDEALELFDRIKNIDPVAGYSALIGARSFPEDPNTLERLERAARVPSMAGAVRAGLLFRLGAAWEKRGDYEKAFELVDEANEQSRKVLPYDAKVHRNRCARIRARFSHALYEHRPDCGVDSELPVYVLGMPRSGTTLVEQILAGHSQIFGAGELGLIPRVAAGLTRWERHVGSGRRYPDSIDDLTPKMVEGIAGNVLRELQELAPDARRVVDKLPHNFEHVGLIKFLFPKARIISVRRDPRAIAISNYFTDYQAKFGGMGFAYDLTDIGEQLADHNNLMHHWHQIFPGEILELQYEDVVDDLEASARRILEYVGVDWEPQVLDFANVDRAVKTASVWQVRQPIYTSSKEKWRRYESRLQPLIRGTNAKIRPEAKATQMLTLPEPGFLARAVAAYGQKDLDEAERNAKKMLHHNPEHAACRYLVGLVSIRKGHTDEGIAEIEAALEKAPHHREWRERLAEVYRAVGRHEDAEKLEARQRKRMRRGRRARRAQSGAGQDDGREIFEPEIPTGTQQQGDRWDSA